MTRLIVVAFAASLTACGSPDPEGGEDLMDQQLEAPDQDLTDANGDSAWELQAEGVATVGGSDQDWQVDIQTDDGIASVGIHSSTHMDLSELDGRTLGVDHDEDDDWDGRFVLSDTEGAVYVSVRAWSGSALDEVLGEGTVGRGADLGAFTNDIGDLYTYYSISIATDEGTVELEPGEVADVVVNGVHWLAGAVAAYDLEREVPEACGATGVFSMELFRISTTTVIPSERLIRPAGRSAAAQGC